MYQRTEWEVASAARQTGAQPKRSRCLICGKPIQQSTEGPWFDMARSTKPLPTCKPTLLIEEGTLHEPDPDCTLQDHASRNHSTMLVFEKPQKSKRQLATPDAVLFE